MVHFITALDCEAQPLVRRYRMKRRGGHGRARFFEGNSARLAVSGVGSLRAAIATTALGYRFADANALWLNIGIAGHQNAEIGTAYIANRITCSESSHAFYPQRLSPAPWDGATVHTLNTPSTEYRFGALFDMEAYGYFAAAMAFTTAEFVHSLKIVSDNSALPADGPFDKEAITDSIASQIDAIEAFAGETAKIERPAAPSPWAVQLRERARGSMDLTETEGHDLKRKLGQLDSLLGPVAKEEISVLLPSLEKKAFFQELQLRIDRESARRICREA